jgi:glycosyltransferase involved in cell wall biosynthesis
MSGRPGLPARRLIYLAHARLPRRRAHAVQIVRMCEAFAQAGWEVRLLCHIGGGAESAQAQAVRPAVSMVGMPVLDMESVSRRVPRRLRPALLRAAWSVSMLVFTVAAVVRLRRDDGAVLYSRDAFPLWVLTRLWPGRARRAFFEAHTCPSRQPGLGLRRDLARRVGGTVLVTRHLDERCRERGVASRRTIVAPNAADGDPAAGERAPERTREDLGWPVEGFIVGYAGRLETMGMDKGVATLGAAVAEIAGEAPPGRTFLALMGPSEKDVARLPGLRADDLLLTGWLTPDRLRRGLRALDACVLPFPWTEHLAYDASPMKLFEYMASGTPIVASDLPSLAEILRHGDNALLVPPDDVGALADALRSLRDDPPLGRRLAAQALRDVQDHTWRSRAERISEFMEGETGS